MERIDLALLIQIFKGFKSTLPRPASPRRFCQFLRGGPGQDLVFAGRGGGGCTSLVQMHCFSRVAALASDIYGIDITNVRHRHHLN